MERKLHGKPIAVGDVVVSNSDTEKLWGILGPFIVVGLKEHPCANSEQFCELKTIHGVKVGNNSWHDAIHKDDFLTEVYKNKGETK